jgi:hypothetical protein
MSLILLAYLCDVTICLVTQRIAFAFQVLFLLHDAFAHGMLGFLAFSSTRLQIQHQM